MNQDERGRHGLVVTARLSLASPLTIFLSSCLSMFFLLHDPASVPLSIYRVDYFSQVDGADGILETCWLMEALWAFNQIHFRLRDVRDLGRGDLASPSMRLMNMTTRMLSNGGRVATIWFHKD